MNDDIVKFWSPPNFFQAPYRSWPHPPTELERIAAKWGIDDEDLRQLLRDEIQRRRVASAGDEPETTPRPHQHGI